MMRVLLLGYDPETVDFSDPALPPVMSVEKVRAGVASCCRATMRRADESRVERPVERGNDVGGRNRAAIIHDDELEAIARKIERLDGLEAPRERISPSVGRDDDRVIGAAGGHGREE